MGGVYIMPTFLNIANYVKDYNLNDSLIRIFKAEKIQRFVIDTLKRRLYDQGMTGSELKLKTDKGNPFYTENYVKVKKRKGEKTSNVTLFLSGGFYQSFKFVLVTNGWRVDADWGFVAVHFKDIYANETDFQQDVMSLTESEIDTTFRLEISPKIQTDFHETIYRP
jgi:hypothetical protein